MSEEILKTKKTDILFVDPRIIKIQEGFNVRLDLGDIQGLSQSIVESGLQVPLKVVKVRGVEEYRLIDGHRRMKAINLAIENGHSIPYVQVTTFTGNEEDEVFAMIITGTGQKQLNEIEQAEAVKRLIGYSYSVEEIAKKIGKSVPHIYNLTYIGNFPKSVKEKVVKGEISANTALMIYRETKDNINEFVSVVDDAITDAQKDSLNGKVKKATTKNVSSLKTKTISQKLIETFIKLTQGEVQNEKVEMLDVILHKAKDMSVDELVEMFSK